MERVIFGVLVGLCLAGLAESVANGEACTTDTDCTADDNVCQFETCRAKIGTTCTTGGSMTQCVSNVTCPTPPGPCVCPPANSHANTDMTMCVLNAGAVCMANSGMSCTHHATCKDSPMRCHCDEGYSADSDMCKAKIGTMCEADDDCVAGTCGTDKMCMCGEGMTTNYDMTMCMKGVNQTCAVAGDCLENSMCSAAAPKMCTCKADYDVEGHRCAKHAGSACTMHSECDMGATCEGTAGSMTCTCKTDYAKDDSTMFCKHSSAVAQMGSLLTVLVLFVTSRML